AQRPALELIPFEPCLADQGPGHRRISVHELRAHLHGYGLAPPGRRPAAREYPSADAVARLDEHHLLPSPSEQTSGIQAACARAYDEGVVIDRRLLPRGYGALKGTRPSVSGWRTSSADYRFAPCAMQTRAPAAGEAELGP